MGGLEFNPAPHAKGNSHAEGAEIDIDKLHESIQEELEKEGGSFLRKITLTTALLAVLAAVAALQAEGRSV